MPHFSIMSIFGTRPEAIKLAPVIKAIERTTDFTSRVLVTAQHRELLDQALTPFGITPDVDLNLMRPGHTLAELTSRAVEGVDRILKLERPDVVLVQGDTTTVFAATLAAFYRGVPVGHVEAGLRSFNLQDPFPEEATRRMVGQIARLHFAPTRQAAANLARENVPTANVLVTGNTVVDALLAIARAGTLPPPPARWAGHHKGDCRVLVTLHRRESWGEPLRDICRGLRRAADSLPNLHIVYPVHPQPRVRETVAAELDGHPRISLIEPLGYPEMVAALKASSFIATDSGGIQEEAPALAKPVLVLRNVTERPEAIKAGTSWLVGTNEQDIFRAVTTLATDRAHYQRMAHSASPFGDGRAAERIVEALRHFLGLSQREPAPFAPSL